MHIIGRAGLLGVSIALSAPAVAAECKKVRPDVELPGPAIGSASECRRSRKDDCSFVYQGVKIGVTSRVVAWKELSGAPLLKARLPFDAKPRDTVQSFLKRYNAIGSRPKLHTVRRNGLYVISTDLCMIGRAGEWYELAFEFNSTRLRRVVERMSIL